MNVGNNWGAAAQTKPGTVFQHKGQIYRVQPDGSRAIKGSRQDVYDDLTPADDPAKIGDMTTSKKSKEPSLIPNAELYIEGGLNLLLIGPHGTGKTATIMEIADNLGLKMKYFSCSTLDPYTDLIGIPTPRIRCEDCGVFETKAEHKAMNPKCSKEVTEFLKNVRPHDLDEAEFLFFDEFNRADPKTLNALFEIIQFKTLNGEPLPNLKVCWAAMNPPNENYEVDQLDPALEDRFDMYIKIDPKPSVSYMESKGIPTQIAAALHKWYSEHIRKTPTTAENRVDYISPRRLEKIGHIAVLTGCERRAIRAALPPSATLDTNKLQEMLTQGYNAWQKQLLGDAYEPEVKSAWDGAGLGDQANPDFTYTTANVKLEKVTIAQWLKDNPNHLPTHNSVADALKMTMGGEALIRDVPMVLDALNPSVLEGFVSHFPTSKVKFMQTGFKQSYADDPGTYGQYKNLHKVLAATASGDFPKSI